MDANGISDSTFTSNDNAVQIMGVSQWIGAVCFVLLLVFTWLPNSYSQMVGWPYILIWQGAFFSICVCTFRQCRKFNHPFTRIGYGLDVVIIWMLISVSLSALNSSFRAVACWNLLLVINYVVVLYFLVNLLRGGLIARHLLWIFLSFVGTVTSVISLAMWRPNADMWLSQSFSAAIRNAHPIGHHNFVGGYALLVFPIVLGASLTQIGWRKWLLATASLSVAVALYISGSRGALIGMLVLGSLATILGIVLSKKECRRRWMVLGICFSLIMSIALYSNPRVRTLFLVNPAVEKSSLSVTSVADGPAKDRVFMIESARNILREHPILGVGPGNLSRVYSNYRPVEAGVGLNLVQQLHNTPVQIAAELGILGVTGYLVFIFILLKLGFKVYENVTESKDRILLLTLAASWLGYGISSLTDYQLENVGIAITLLSTVALLINLADATQLSPLHFGLKRRDRRFWSMGLLILLCANFQLWTRVDTGLYLSHMAVQEAKSLNLAGADAKWAKASQLVPWDPTYPALAAETVLELTDGLESEDDIQDLRELAIEYLTKAVEAAPNDPWFNQNLAALLLENGNATDAEPYATRAIHLSPRDSNNYTYYTLGLSLLQQGKKDKAVEAFSLESLANPIFLTASNWNKEPLLSVRDEVVSNTLKSYREILSVTNEVSLQYAWLYEQWAMLSWWYEYPISVKEREKLRPLVQAMLVSNEDPQEALQLIEEHISNNGNRANNIYLIQARLSPERYLSELTAKLDGTTDERSNLEENLKRKGTMQTWLSEATTSAKTQTRYALVFAYRNLAANVIRKILYPGDIQNSVLLSAGDLFKSTPREYPQLDRYMADVRSKQFSNKKL